MLIELLDPVEKYAELVEKQISLEIDYACCRTDFDRRKAEEATDARWDHWEKIKAAVKAEAESRRVV